jgi:integrase
LRFPLVFVSTKRIGFHPFAHDARDYAETKLRLTDISIRALETPATGVVVYADDTLSGFGVRVSSGGTKSYVLTHGPRRTRETIGRVDVLKLSEAREEAKRRLAGYTLGRVKPLSITWNAAMEEYFAEHGPKLKARTYADYSYYLNRHFRYGTTKLDELSPYTIASTINKLGNRPSTQRYAYGVIRAVMRWAHRKHYVDRNPMERMQNPQRYIPRERVLTDDELRQVWRAAGDDTFGKIVKLLILTGQRKGEITKLTGDMVGENTITFPALLTKNGRKHTIPLGTTARVLLDPISNESGYFFLASGKTTPFNGYSTCKPKLDKRSGVPNWTLHDLRRTFASGLAAQGVQLPVIERMLNHISGSFGGIVGVYQRYDFMPEMRDAIAKWESHLQNLMGNS